MGRRLTNEEEMALVTPDEEDRNIKSFENILQYFCLNNESEQKVLDFLHKENLKDNSFLDNFLDLNNQRRAWYEIDILSYEDESYKKYCSVVRNTALYHPNSDYFYFKQLHVLLDYKNFINGTIYIDGQTYKLFKFLLKNNLINKETIDFININKNKTEKIYVCISRNPIDYLFCSTNQSFSSCLNLENGGEGCYWLGIPGAIVDPNRCVVFRTKGNKKSYTIKNNNFTHIRYKCRAWGLLSNKESLYVLYEYPSLSTQIRTDVKELIGENKTTSRSYFDRSMFKIEPIRFEDDEKCLIYLDDIGIYEWNDGVYYDVDSGYTGESFNYNEFLGNFEDIVDIDSLCNTCYNCGYAIHSEIMYQYGYMYCMDCHEKLFSTCSECGGVCYNADIKEYSYQHSGRAYIEVVCYSCSKYLKLKECENCGSFTLPKDLDEDGYCFECS